MAVADHFPGVIKCVLDEDGSEISAETMDEIIQCGESIGTVMILQQNEIWYQGLYRLRYWLKGFGSSNRTPVYHWSGVSVTRNFIPMRPGVIYYNVSCFSQCV